MAKTKKNYTIEVKNFSNAIIKTSRGNSQYYPFNAMYDYLEVSAEIDTEKISLKTDFRDNTKIDWHYRLMRNETDSLANWQGLESAERLASAEAIEEAKTLIIKSVKGIKKLLKAGKNHPIYSEMAEIVSSKVKHFHADFNYHDVMTLAGLNPEEKFIWICRNCGTWLLADIQSKGILDYSVKENKYRNDADSDFYYWYNGKTLEHVTGENAQKHFNTLEVKN